MTADPPQRYIADACEVDLIEHGDNYRGAGYTHSEAEAEERYGVMLNVIREPGEPVSVLDLGCGLGHMLDHVNRTERSDRVRYTGLDISPKYLAAARARNPGAEFILADILDSDDELGEYDYVILNGVFNWRGDLDQEQMLSYWERLLGVAFRHCRRGLAFNVMSKIVDWERDDLFHLPFETMAQFVAANLSRHFVVRHDYEAYEYTTYVYRTPSSS